LGDQQVMTALPPAITTSPANDHAADWRIRFLLGMLMTAGVVLAVRLVQLQWFDRDQFAERANRQRTFVVTMTSRPGDIVDRNGRLLATTVSVRSLYVVPALIANPMPIARDIALVLDMDADLLAKRLRSKRSKQFLWVKRRLTVQQAAKIRALRLPAEMWGFRREFLRRYPQGRLAAHILGLRGIDGNGRGGVEQKFDAILHGRDGLRVLVRDARGRVIDVDDAARRPPQHGRTIVLTLDAIVQLYVERELDELVEQWRPRSACAVVVDPRSSELLAMASWPTFDPNNPVDVPAAAWKNTVIASMYEPGSTFKPFVVAWAIDHNVVACDETFDCENGSYRMGRRVLHDHPRHGVLSVSDILVKSSNIGMAKIGERLTNSGLYNATVAFGFGRRTGTELPGEIFGLVRPLSGWDSYSTGSIPMGQELAVTPLQLIVAYAALANGGKLANPRLVLRDVDAITGVDGAYREPIVSPVVSQTVSAETARWLVTGPLRNVVERGTGRQAQLDSYDVFGKTGTAQKLDRSTGRYSSTRLVCSFICGAPVDNPQVLVLVLVDEPTIGTSHFGGVVSAPAASRILLKTLRHLRIPPTGPSTRSAHLPTR
jgi:cell division protein FtsI/penicillin-binding protein 2